MLSAVAFVALRSHFAAISNLRFVKTTAILVFAMVTSQTVLCLEARQCQDVCQGHAVGVIAEDAFMGKFLCSILLMAIVFHEIVLLLMIYRFDTIAIDWL